MGMMDYGGMIGRGLGVGFGIVYFALAAFVFSVIFWPTYNWIVRNSNKKRK